MQSSGSVDTLASCINLVPSESTNVSSRESISSSVSDGLGGNCEDADRIIRLEQELNAARNSIAEKEAKCTQLSELQNQVDSEVQELTEKLFQEAYRMVNDAESRRAKAEKLLAESHLKVDMLIAEVEALKVIVKSPVSSSSQITHLTSVTHQRTGLASRFLGNTRRKERHSSANSRKSYTLPSSGRDSISAQSEERELVSEIDPIYHKEFTQWREGGASLEEDTPFLSRIIAEDIRSCLNFSSTKLTEQVLNAIKANTLELEAVSEVKPTVRTCALSMVPRFCPYKMRVNSGTEWCYISLLARNRAKHTWISPSNISKIAAAVAIFGIFKITLIAAVCDFFTYIRYVNQGIIKCGVHDSYWDIITLRKNMTLARLGLNFIPKIGGSQAGIS